MSVTHLSSISHVRVQVTSGFATTTMTTTTEEEDIRDLFNIIYAGEDWDVSV